MFNNHSTDMVTIGPDQVTPDILVLFDLSRPTMARGFNLLEGVTQGRTLVDDPSGPCWMILRDEFVVCPD